MNDRHWRRYICRVASGVFVLACFLATGCGRDSDDVTPASVTLVGAATANGCEEITLDLDVSFGAVVYWLVDGVAPIALDVTPHSVSFRAPPYPRDRDVTLRAVAVDADGGEASAEHTVTVAGEPALSSETLGTVPGCGRFQEGVASGDPGPNDVLIWTRVAPNERTDTVPLTWFVASDVTRTNIIARGTVEVGPDTDHTALVLVNDLQPYRAYTYWFETEDGERSRLGRTRTAPEGTVDSLRVASLSCSSIFSGFFNAYADLALRDDIDLVMHLGDYFYDTVDPQERMRVSDPVPDAPSSPATWRERARLYLSDPDLREARAAHPWMAVWDNHDADESPDEAAEGSVNVFREYIPMRGGDTPREAWRHLSYGELLDVYMLDITVPRVRVADGETPGIDAMFGPDQWRWLLAELPGSSASWRIVGNQKLLTTFNLGTATTFGDPTPWDDYAASRSALLTLLGDHDDNVVVSGDLHFSIANDLVDSPVDPVYEVDSGRSVGVELLATSVSRGNFDETICEGLCDSAGLRIIDGILGALLPINPHTAYFELIEHGYGVIEFTEERATAELWYVPIREPDVRAQLGVTLVTERGSNRWTRDAE
ncbi:MAG: alkaline phosphatase D [Bradymonadia bacterium]|jgi:alkaline phosphatase D